jgi:hypothetical protein
MRIIPTTLFLIAVLTSATFAQDQDDAKAQDKINQRDFAFQGEYVGEIGPEGERQGFGLQVIAIGNGQFRVVAFNGGLPGEDWTGVDHEAIDVIGEYDEAKNAVEFWGYEKANAILKDGVATISTSDDILLGELRKVVRESETLGLEPPEGAAVLFDGTDVENWKNGQMTDDGLLKQGTTSKPVYGDHQLHIEFQLPFMPNAKGQGRGNSGLYIQGRYEIQMLDSFGLEGKQNECGGIYSIKAPDLNMCFPPSSWQTYDVEFTAARFNAEGEQSEPARISVKHNGILIHDDVELPARKTTAAPVDFGPKPGPVYLQNHGNEVRYRNIWVKEK